MALVQPVPLLTQRPLELHACVDALQHLWQLVVLGQQKVPGPQMPTEGCTPAEPEGATAQEDMGRGTAAA